MKYFICPIYRISLGIPAEQTLRIITLNRNQTSIFENDNEDTFISLPVLLKQKDTTSPHGIVLKSEKPGKTVLMVPRVEIDLEIPEENIQRLPEVFSDFFRYFKGIYFNGDNSILILNPEKLMEACND